MSSRAFYVDFGKKQGKIKPLYGINGGPLVGGALFPHDMSAEYSELGIPLVRCVMPDGSYGYNQLLCVHSIFPDFSLDECDERSYNFAPTDNYLLKIRDTGAEIFYTLGESCEPYGRPLYAKSPADKEKWARICEHIVMHYNESWAAGYKWNIKYFEIWNGADFREGFADGGAEFFELYRVVANHLKARFPRIKVGGFGATGFASLNRIDVGDDARKIFDFTTDFLTYVGKNDTKAPLDFFTWKCYAKTPEELFMHSKYARAYLDAAGHRRAKSIICEFGAATDGRTPPALWDGYPSFFASSLILAQKGATDALLLSTAEPHDARNALYTVDDGVTHRHYVGYEVALAFSELYRLGSVAEVSDDYPREINILAAKGNVGGMVLLSSRTFSGRVEISLRGSDYSTCSVKRIAPGGERGEGRVSCLENLKIAADKIVLSVKCGEIYTISLS